MEVTRRWYLGALPAVGIAAPRRLWLPAKRSTADYTPDFFVFEGDTYLTRSEPLNGATDGRSGGFVFKALPPPVRNNVVHEYWCSANKRVQLIRDTANRVAVLLSDGTHVFRFRTHS